METATDNYEKIAKLVVQSRNGNAVAFEQLVRMHIRSATAVALAITGRVEDAEDVAQNAFILAYRKLHTCKDIRRFSGWLLQIVKNQSLNYVSGTKKRERYIDNDSDHLISAPGSVENAAIEKQLVLKALSSLGTTQRQIVLLHSMEGWTHEEISEFLSISVESSRWHLFNARKTMKLNFASVKESQRKTNHE